MLTPVKPVKPKTRAERRLRVEAILSKLDEMYPEATCALVHRTPWELLVATILSAQCTDKRVNEVTPELFRKYPTPRDFAAVSQAELSQDIRSTGFFNNKAKSLIGAAQKIITDFGGKVPRTMDEMLTIPDPRGKQRTSCSSPLRNRLRNCSGHARPARFAAAGSHAQHRAG